MTAASPDKRPPAIAYPSHCFTAPIPERLAGRWNRIQRAKFGTACRELGARFPEPWWDFIRVLIEIHLDRAERLLDQAPRDCDTTWFLNDTVSQLRDWNPSGISAGLASRKGEKSALDRSR